jgi:hypothetical protein
VLIPSLVLLVYAWGLGAVFFWDVRGMATRTRRRYEARALYNARYWKLPSWAFRAFGIWCFVFGVGEFLLFNVAKH